MRPVTCAVAILAAAQLGHAEPPPLTEAQAVALALGRAPLGEVLEGAVEAARGRALTARAHPNPELALSREQTFGEAGTTETYLTATQAIDLGGQRALRGDAAEARAAALRLEGAATRLELAAHVRERFYDVLHRQQRVAALGRWVAHVEDAFSIVARREARGDASVYDRKRLDRERRITKLRLATEEAELHGGRVRLQALLGSEIGEAVAGTLLPAEVPGAEALRARAAARPDLLATQHLLVASDRDQRAAARWWIPELRLELGWKGVSLANGGRTDGYLAGLALALPIWDRAAGALRTAQGEARVARGKRGLLEAQLAAELEGARQEAARRRQLALDFAQGPPAAELVTMASRGYAAGELGVIELLDAFQGAADDELTVLELEHAARRARIALDRLTGAP